MQIKGAIRASMKEEIPGEKTQKHDPLQKYGSAEEISEKLLDRLIVVRAFGVSRMTVWRSRRRKGANASARPAPRARTVLTQTL